MKKKRKRRRRWGEDKEEEEGDGEEEWKTSSETAFPKLSLHLFLLFYPIFSEHATFTHVLPLLYVDSCLACSGKVLWVPSFPLMPYPSPSLMPYPSFPSSPTVVLWPPVHACEILPESVVYAEYVHESVTKKEPEWEPQSITALGPDVLIFLNAYNKKLNGTRVSCGFCLESFFNLCFSYVDCLAFPI